MIAASDRRPGSVAAHRSYEGDSPGARCAERLSRVQTAFPGLRSFGSPSSGCQSRLSRWGVGPAGAISFLDYPSGVMEGNPWHLLPARLSAARAFCRLQQRSKPTRPNSSNASLKRSPIGQTRQRQTGESPASGFARNASPTRDLQPYGSSKTARPN